MEREGTIRTTTGSTAAKELNHESRPACGQCHSTAVYCDADPLNNSKIIRCLKCGNQYPGIGPGFYMTGGGKDMSKEKKPCRNCKDVKTVVNDGLDYKCYQAVRGLKKGSKEYDDALAEVVRKIKNGEIKTRSTQIVDQGKTKPVNQSNDHTGAVTTGTSKDTRKDQSRFAATNPEVQIFPVVIKCMLEIDVRIRGISAI